MSGKDSQNWRQWRARVKKIGKGGGDMRGFPECAEKKGPDAFKNSK